MDQLLNCALFKESPSHLLGGGVTFFSGVLEKRQTYVTHHDNTSRAYESIAGGQQAFDNVRGLPYPGFAWMSACQPS